MILIIDTLHEISNNAQEESEDFTKNTTEIDLNEDVIQPNYYLAFRAFTKRSVDTPKHACISCTKYCFERYIIKIKVCIRENATAWSNFVNNVGFELNKSYIIYKYCNHYYKNNKISLTCRINNLEVLPVPEEIATLNDYEQILIQRAKAFQTVQRMATVMNKNLTPKYIASKVKGRTFHLLLPLEETLTKICSSTEPINLNHELYIIL